MLFRTRTFTVAVLSLLIVVSYAHEPNRLRAVGAAKSRTCGDSISLNVQAFEPTRDALIAAGSVNARVVFEFTEAEIAHIERQIPAFWDQLRLLGWQREGDSAVRVVPARGAVIHRDGERILIKESQFAFVGPQSFARSAREEFSRSPRLTVSVMDVTVPSEQVAIIQHSDATDSPLRVDILININVRNGEAQMCHTRSTRTPFTILPDATSSEPMDPERCLDYNGTNTDGNNYPRSDWRAWRNFVGSDCDIALGQGYCWSEYITKKSCWETHGERICSKLIGHSTSYHTHSS